jgi:hypothetical protein
MDSILYYTEASNATDAELLEINTLRKAGNNVAVRNGALRPENAKSFEINFDKVMESGSVVKVDEKPKVDSEPKAPVISTKPFFIKEKA